MPAQNRVELLLRVDNRSRVALSIPLAQCTTFAVRPLKWLRFLGFAIYGREGYLSTSKNGPELDYTAGIEACSYYYILDGEPRFVDVDALNGRTSMASELSSGRANFREKLIERDGTCVLTGSLDQHCIACHLIPHAKGDNYILNLFNHRREAYSAMGSLSNINDTRNGILLYHAFHSELDRGRIAFLKTPNFALTVDDIPYHQPPNAGNPANRLTLHHIQPSQVAPALPLFGPHNSDARQPQDVSEWPSGILVDLCYAAAALQAWGPHTFIKYARKKSRDSYYEGGTADNNGGNVPGGSIAQVPGNASARTIRYHTRSTTKSQGVDSADRQTFSDMFDVVMALWTMSAREAAQERRLSGGNDTDAVDNENKIRTWLRSVEDDGSEFQEGANVVAERDLSSGGGDAPSSFPYRPPSAR